MIQSVFPKIETKYCELLVENLSDKSSIMKSIKIVNFEYCDCSATIFKVLNL